ncbi:regucalcin-like [Diabrotica undecimpunctata]|uniref:regucalcin-like n=1 Tax=Diabrotica undecimpunctata TaxID=50387 RepID=UPI003B6370D0
MAPVVEKLLSGFLLSEGPHWDDKKQCLYFVDILKSTINRYVPSTKEHTWAKLDDHNISIIIPVKDRENYFIVAVDRSVCLVNWDGQSKEVANIETLVEIEEGTEHVLNDGKCDNTGRLWIGTMGASVKALHNLKDGQGGFYSIANKTVQLHRDNVGCSNGLAFDYKLKKLYYNDSLKGTLDEYDFDIESGTISNLNHVLKNFGDDQSGDKVLVLDPEEFSGVCDGMTIDSEGNLWVVIIGSSKIVQIKPGKPATILQSVEFPTPQITSIAFGGPNLDELYVTSANFSSQPKGESPGCLFRVTGLNCKGIPADVAVI